MILSNAEIEKLAELHLEAHAEHPVTIRTAGDITKCECSKCHMARYIQTASAVVKALRDERDMWKGAAEHLKRMYASTAEYAEHAASNPREG